MIYQNPIQVKPVHNREQRKAFRDPFILRIDGTYYMTGTKTPYFEEAGKCTGVSLYSSENLLDWKYESELLTRPDESKGKWYQNYFWAPELFQYNDKFYMTVNCSRGGPGKQLQEVALLVADQITGPYTIITEEDSLIVGNDATLFRDDDGKIYMFVTGVQGMEVDLEHGKILGEPFDAFGPNPVPEQFDSIGCEGPFVVKRGGLYYCFYSTWARGYEVSYATADNIRGPWTKYAEPIYGGIEKERIDHFNQEKGWNIPYTPEIYDHPFVEVGHNSVFQTSGGIDYIAAHVYQQPGIASEVSMAIDRIDFKEGIVTVNGGKRGPSYTPQNIEL